MLISCPFYLHNTHTTVFRLVRPLLVEFVVSLVYASVSLRALAILYVDESKNLLLISSIFILKIDKMDLATLDNYGVDDD